MTYLIVFGAGCVAGAFLPSYTDQYRQSLHARFDQVSIDIRPFQEIADRYHGGSLDALIEHHLASEDPTFHDEGLAIRQMLDSQAMLAEANHALEASVVDQAAYFIRDADRELVRQTWAQYTPTFVPTGQALRIALTSGLLLCAFVFVLSRGVRLVVFRR